MGYITIYSTNDNAEVSILRNLFEQKDIHYNILGEVTNASAGIAATGNQGIRVQVQEDDRERAKEVLVESGFLGQQKPASRRSPRRPAVNKWVLIFLAALVLVIVAILIAWFMNVG